MSRFREISTVRLLHGLVIVLCFAATSPTAVQAETATSKQAYSFGVINQRSVTLTAQYWNPILNYISAISGVHLRLKMERTAPETTAQTLAGEHDFVYTNHLFTPERDRLGFKVILRMDTAPIHAVVAVPESSPVTELTALERKTVVFPSKEAFVGFWVPMDQLLRISVTTEAIFAGNQEGAIARLRARGADAAGLNESTLKSYAARENFAYRVLWRSEPYLDIPIMARPDLPEELVAKVQNAFAQMAADPDGAKVLAESAAAMQSKPIGFVRASNGDYSNYRTFYRTTKIVAH